VFCILYGRFGVYIIEFAEAGLWGKDEIQYISLDRRSILVVHCLRSNVLICSCYMQCKRATHSSSTCF